MISKPEDEQDLDAEVKSVVIAQSIEAQPEKKTTTNRTRKQEKNWRKLGSNQKRSKIKRHFEGRLTNSRDSRKNNKRTKISW